MQSKRRWEIKVRVPFISTRPIYFDLRWDLLVAEAGPRGYALWTPPSPTHNVWIAMGPGKSNARCRFALQWPHPIS